MYSQNLKQELTRRANLWASQNSFSINSRISPAPVWAVLFDDLKGNFHKGSLTSIQRNSEWRKRLKKPHQKHGALGFREMQSSNSSDALLMNIFCYPGISKWKGVEILFGQNPIISIEFGYNPPLLKNGLPEPRPTEIDLLLNNKFICEAKLTESDFTEKEKQSVEAYDNFDIVFERRKLSQNDEVYFHYQLIRNILAAYAEQKEFMLLCDYRRPDLGSCFY
jgi:hypothetical protein